MKKIFSIVALLGLLNAQGMGGMGMQNPSVMVNRMPKYNLTQREIEDLEYMYEEEKLARDVYLTLGKRYRNIRPLVNIPRSEQRHMDAVKALLNKYNIKVANNPIGKFSNSKIQSLYNYLLVKGSKSPQSAINVGIEVEKLDIKDLKEKIANTHKDIQTVYNSLLRGSYKHLKVFSNFANGGSFMRKGMGQGRGMGGGRGMWSN